MSRTYKKNIRCFIATGDNRWYYKNRRRERRRKDNHELSTLLANYIPEIVEELLRFDGFHMPKKDLWREPTDGHYAINKDYIKTLNRKYSNGGEYFEKKYNRYLKPKHSHFKRKI